MRRIPATIVTGFLGAGKTSLVRHLLAAGAGYRLAVLVNEFGELGIHRELPLCCGAAPRAADPAVDHDNPLEEVFTDQLACSDLVILNKADLVDDMGLSTLRTEIEAQLRPGVKLLAAAHGRVAPAVALGLAAAAEDGLSTR